MCMAIKRYIKRKWKKIVLTAIGVVVLTVGIMQLGPRGSGEGGETDVWIKSGTTQIKSGEIQIK